LNAMTSQQGSENAIIDQIKNYVSPTSSPKNTRLHTQVQLCHCHMVIFFCRSQSKWATLEATRNSALSLSAFYITLMAPFATFLPIGISSFLCCRFSNYDGFAAQLHFRLTPHHPYPMVFIVVATLLLIGISSCLFSGQAFSLNRFRATFFGVPANHISRALPVFRARQSSHALLNIGCMACITCLHCVDV
jgi:hypothetical protein